MEQCPPRSADQAQLRILLSHSPDQLPLGPPLGFRLDVGRPHARRANSLASHRSDLCPSWHGVHYASGILSTPTVMHVSRGIAGEDAAPAQLPPGSDEADAYAALCDEIPQRNSLLPSRFRAVLSRFKFRKRAIGYISRFRTNNAKAGTRVANPAHSRVSTLTDSQRLAMATMTKPNPAENGRYCSAHATPGRRRCGKPSNRS